jgi:NAD(P)-dependent dehydrogenase (short-subunit alcohol dehydrogenase family)
MALERADVLHARRHAALVPPRPTGRHAFARVRAGRRAAVARDLQGSVVVITGASSGIGRASAHAFAREGARLVLASRAAEPLQVVADEAERLGGTAVAVPTDVRDEEAVRALAAGAIERFGRLDVWVNCAGVMAYGRFEAVPAEVFRAVIETNLFGQVHAARAVLPRFRAQGTGVLINLSSVWGRVTTPDVSAYVTSKFAVRAFSECLRHELRDMPDVDVATMLPQAVDTPIFGHAANYAGREVRPVPPMVDPHEVARGIVACARSPKREVTYKRAGRALELAHSLAPGLYERILPSAFEAGNYADATVAATDGQVLRPVPGDRSIEGGWRRERRAELARAFAGVVRGAARGLRGR